MQLTDFFESLWTGYVAVTPQAAVIHAAFTGRGETVVNDHVAFRTFDQPPLSMACLEPHLLALGYRRHAPYEFPLKRLRACAYVHPAEGAPRVFLSELISAECSTSLQRLVARICASTDAGLPASAALFCVGRPWPAVTWEEYLQLRAESEYAAWVAALGLRANHFTVSVNALRGFESVREVVDFVAGLGFRINEDGGRIKGGPEVLLEQAATLADQLPIGFAAGEEHVIPTCYYEFARRYPDADGHLYQGFVAASADRIFTSTRAAG